MHFVDVHFQFALEFRHGEDVVHQRGEQFGVVDDELAELGAVVMAEVGVFVGKDLRETHNGVERSAYFVAHVLQEQRFQAFRFLGFVEGFLGFESYFCEFSVLFAQHLRHLSASLNIDEKQNEHGQHHANHNHANELLVARFGLFLLDDLQVPFGC